MSIPLPDLADFERDSRAASQILSSQMLPHDKCKRISELCDVLTNLFPESELTAEDIFGIYSELGELTKPGSSFPISIFVIKSMPIRCFSDVKNPEAPENIKKVALDVLVNLSFCFGKEEGTLKNKLIGQYSLQVLMDILLSGNFIDEILTILTNYSTKNMGIFEMVNTQIFEELQSFITEADNPELTNRALWIASNMFSTCFNHDKPFIDGAIHFFAQFCQGQIEPFCARALIGLANILRRNKEFLEEVLSMIDAGNVFGALSGEFDLPAAAISFLSSAMCEGIAEGFPLEIFPDLLENEDLHDSAATLLAEIFEVSEKKVLEAAQSGIINKFIEVCVSKENDINLAITVMSAINKVPEIALRPAIELGFVPKAVSFLDQSNKSCACLVLNFINLLTKITDQSLKEAVVEQLTESECIDLVENWMSDIDLGSIAEELFPMLEETLSS